MPSLREVQAAVRRSIVDRDDGAAAAYVVSAGIAPEGRLAVYRNTFQSSLVKTLGLTYPAVRRLVGEEFFEGAALAFIHCHPPRSGWLDAYGGELADFLEGFPPAAALAYLPDVARLEWAVCRAIHAPDAQPLAAAALAGLDACDHERLRLVPRPSLGLLTLDWPADAIWRAVLEDDEAALGSLALDRGRYGLLVQRGLEGIEVSRCEAAAFDFIADLVSGRPLGAVLEAHPGVDATAVLAELLTGGRLAGLEVAPQDGETTP